MQSTKPNIAHQFPVRSGNGSDNHGHPSFEEQYLALRKKEKRLYTDQQVMQLPAIEPGHPHYQEWIARKQSSDRLIRYIRGMHRPLSILEVGCGNGWLASRLAAIPGTTVTGYDINLSELKQAERVFKQPNLAFQTNDPFLFRSNDRPFDVIVFAASLQYFPSLDAVICDALRQLRPAGSIHIIDTHFYKPRDVPAAKQRTIDHFTRLGFPALSRYYFHHTLPIISKFNYHVLYNPDSRWNKWFGGRNSSPFHWIEIKKQ